MWRCPLGLLLLLLAGEWTLGARRGRGRRELAPGLHLRGIRDAGGRYCQGQDLCCRGRADDCALPYLGATCYCDLFCNRTVSDCCPDFWDFCLGVPPPFPPIQGCTHGSRIYPVLGTYWDNCNRWGESGEGGARKETSECRIRCPCLPLPPRVRDSS